MQKIKPIYIVIAIFAFIIILAIVLSNIENKNKITNQITSTNNDVVTPPTVIEKKIYWTLSSFVDDFGDDTKNKFIETTTEGTFSNSATMNSFLGVRILFTKKNIGLFMHEYNYGRSPESFIGDGSIMMKNSDGVVVKGYTGNKWNNGGGIAINGNSYTRIKNFLMKSKGEIKVNVKDDYSSTYDFTINADGFAEKFKEL